MPTTLGCTKGRRTYQRFCVGVGIVYVADEIVVLAGKPCSVSGSSKTIVSRRGCPVFEVMTSDRVATRSRYSTLKTIPASV